MPRGKSTCLLGLCFHTQPTTHRYPRFIQLEKPFFYHQSDAKAASDALTTRLQLKNLLNQTAVRKSRHDTELLPDIGDFGIVGIMTMCNVIDRCVIHERFQAFHVVTG